MRSSAWPDPWPDPWRLALADGDARREVRASLFRLQAELFATAPVRDRGTIEAFGALALGFLPLVDEAAVIEVAAVLAPCQDTPEAVLAGLCHRSSRARDAVLNFAPLLTDRLADEIIGAGVAAAAALAARADLGEPVQAKLLALHDDDVDHALAANRTLALSAMAREQLVARARARLSLARALLSRADLDLWEQAALYLYADEALQTEIRDRIAGSAVLQSRPLPQRAGSDAVEELLRLAAAGDVAALEAALARWLGLQDPVDWRFLRPERHPLLALALSAAGVPAESADRIVATIHPVLAHSVRAVFELGAIVRSVPRATAMLIVEAVAGSRIVQQRPGRHRPSQDPSGAPARVPAPVRSPRRAPRSARLQAEPRERPPRPS